MTAMKNILIVDNHIATCNLLSKFLVKNKYEVETTTRGQAALEIFKKRNYDLILADFHLPDMCGMYFFDEIKKANPSTRMILMGKQVNLKNAVEMVRRGAANFISKPLNPDELIDVLKEAERTFETSERTNGRESNTPHPFQAEQTDLVIGQSPRATAMTEQVLRVGPTNFSVILQGETGTGKESIARQIHLSSPRKGMPFVAVDCGCLSKEIAGSELFGHEKGSFTGAVSQKSGFFEQAHGGTLFLDEIANLPLEIQIGLLRVLQEKVVRRVGGSKEIPVDVRIIVATNENLLDKSGTSNFREDLYFRLCEYTLEVPALRDRMEDLPIFVGFFLKQACQELGKPVPHITEEVMDYLRAYDWPGNIRELRNVVRRASLFADRENKIQKNALPSRIKNYGDTLNLATKSIGYGMAETGAQTYDLKSTALKAEYQRIIEVLEKVRFNKTKAAEILNIHRKTLYVKLRRLNIPY